MTQEQQTENRMHRIWRPPGSRRYQWQCYPGCHADIIDVWSYATRQDAEAAHARWHAPKGAEPSKTP